MHDIKVNADVPSIFVYKVGATVLPRQATLGISNLVREAFCVYTKNMLSPALPNIADQLLNSLWPAPLKYLVQIEGDGARWFHINMMKSAKGMEKL